MDKYTAISNCLSAEFPTGSELIDLQLLATIISKETYYLKQELGFSNNKTVKLVYSLFPDKPRDSVKVCTFLLRKYNLKYCSSCKEVLSINLFNSNKSRKDGFSSQCAKCSYESAKPFQNALQATYRANKIDRTPKWANIKTIKEFYSKCPDGYHVDHIIPLNGELVSGLHVLENLQYLPAIDNIVKSNKYEV